MNDEPCMCGTPFTCLADDHSDPVNPCGDRRMRWRCALPADHDGDHEAKPNKTRPSARWPQ